MKTKVSNDEPHVWDVTFTGQEATRPGGVRHEIEFDNGVVTFREVWYFSDNGEVQQCDERKLGLNDAVHVMVNITDNECREFSEVRTTRPKDVSYPKGFSRHGVWANFTEEEAHACAKDCIPENDHSCGCDDMTGGCAWCDDNIAAEWIDTYRKATNHVES